MKKCLVAAACGCLSIGVYAEETNAVTKANQTIITATRIETPIEQIGSSINVIDTEFIETRKPKNAQDALEQTAGVQNTRNGGPGTASSTFIRGANANHTVVLINGVRVNSNTTGDFNLSRIPTDSIERIEVLKGAQSAIYGADAIGGVINIITKKGATEPLSGSVSVALGEKGFSEETLSLSGGNGMFDLNTVFSYSELNKYDIADSKHGSGNEDDPSRRFSFYNNLGLNFLDDGRADLTVLYNRNCTELDNGWTVQTDDPDRDTESKELVVGLNVSKPITDRYTQSVRTGFSKLESEGRDNGTQEYLFESSSYELALQSDVEVTENNTLSLGYEGRRFEAMNSGSYTEETTDQHSAFANNLLNLSDILFITLGTRYDSYSDFDSEMTWSAAASWFVLENTRLHGNVGTGYKVPTMNDLYWPADAWGNVGNPNLQPEKSKSFDLGIEQTLLDGALIADATFFKSTIEDIIVWAPITPGSWSYTPSNVNEAEIKGAELSLTAKPTESISATAFYTYTDAEDAETGNELHRRAKNTAGISGKWEYSDRGSIYAGATYTGTRFDDKSNTRKMDRFALVNVGTSYQLSEVLSIFANVDNLFDKEYETAYGYGTVGRLASIGVKGEF